MKKFLIKCSIFFLLFMILFTVISRVTNSLTIPRIKTMKVRSMKLEYHFEFPAIILGKVNNVISLPEEIIVDNIYINMNNIIEMNDIILSFDKKSVDTKLQALNNEYSKLQNEYDSEKQDHNDKIKATEENIRYVKEILRNEKNQTNDSPSSSYEASYSPETSEETMANILNSEKELATLQQELNSLYNKQITTNLSDMEKINNEIIIYQTLVNNNYDMYSNINGSVVDINITIGEKTTSNNFIIVSNDMEGLKVVGNIPLDDNKYYSLNQTVSIKDNSTNQIISNQEKINQIYKKTATDSDSSESYVAEIYLNVPDNKYPLNTPVTVSTDSLSDLYKNCLASSAIKVDENKKYYIQYINEENTIMGKITTVKNMYVKVERNNEQFVALSEDEPLSNLDVVYDSNKPLYSGDRVFVENDIQNE